MREIASYVWVVAFAAIAVVTVLAASDARSAAPRAEVETSAVPGVGALPADAYVAYSTRRDDQDNIWVVRLDGSGRRRITRGSDSIGPVVSPDGKLIAFSSSYDVGAFIMGADGRGVRRLATGGGDPAWSADGRRLAYSDRTGLWVVNRDGSGRRRVARIPRTSNVFGAVWSPDGRKIAFFTARGTVRKTTDTGGTADIPRVVGLVVVNADGSGLRKLVAARGGDCCAAWSADGRRVAFARARHVVCNPECRPRTSEIRLVDVDGSGERRLVARAWAPAGSPDGRKIAFLRDGIYVMNSDGSGLRRIAPRPARAPVWSADGRALAFNTFTRTHTGPVDLAVMRPDGSNRRDVWVGNDISGFSLGGVG